MDSPASGRKHMKDRTQSLRVLNSFTRNNLITMALPSANSDYQLLYNSKKRCAMAVHKIQIPKANLLKDIDIYEWRHQT